MGRTWMAAGVALAMAGGCAPVSSEYEGLYQLCDRSSDCPTEYECIRPLSMELSFCTARCSSNSECVSITGDPDAYCSSSDVGGICRLYCDSAAECPNGASCGGVGACRFY